MNTVFFPEVNLNLEISQIAFQIFGINIYNYAVCIFIGIVLAILLALKSKENYNIKFENFIEIIIITLITGIIGARLYYVIFNFEMYSNNFLEIFNIRKGGLAIFGGLIVGGFTAIIMCVKKQIDILDFFDYICPFLALSQAIGRIGNFFNIEAYGTETTSFFRMGIMTNEGYVEVHPCFLYEFIGCFVIFIILRIFQKNRKYKGQIIGSYMCLYGIIRFFIEGIRADSLMIYSFKVSQIVSIVFIILGVISFVKNNKKLIYFKKYIK